MFSDLVKSTFKSVETSKIPLFLAALAYQITVATRTYYTRDSSISEESAEKAMDLNEMQHQVTACLRGNLSGENSFEMEQLAETLVRQSFHKRSSLDLLQAIYRVAATNDWIEENTLNAIENFLFSENAD